MHTYSKKVQRTFKSNKSQFRQIAKTAPLYRDQCAALGNVRDNNKKKVVHILRDWPSKLAKQNDIDIQ